MFAWLLVIAMGLTGCGSLNARNTSFDVTYDQARQDLRRMTHEPKGLERPLIYVGPFLDPGLSNYTFTHDARNCLHDERIHDVAFNSFSTFDAHRDKLIALVDRLYPSDDPQWTTEVDVVGFSMGGLVSRYAAMPPDAERGQSRRLKIKRLFTVSTPHRGAQLAPLGAWANRLARDMQPGSAFIEKLNAAWPQADYELYPYIRLGDLEVNPQNGAPPGQSPHWVSSRLFESQHMFAIGDARIRDDIFRRLRGEPPLTRRPAAPLPGNKAKS